MTLYNDQVISTNVTRDEMYANNLKILVNADRRARANHVHNLQRIIALEASLKQTRLVLAGTIGLALGGIIGAVPAVFW